MKLKLLLAVSSIQSVLSDVYSTKLLLDVALWTSESSSGFGGQKSPLSCGLVDKWEQFCLWWTDKLVDRRANSATLYYQCHIHKATVSSRWSHGLV